VRALLVFASVLVWQIIVSTLIAPYADIALLPDLSIVWLVYLADEPAPAAAREREVFIRNMFYVAVLAYLDSRMMVAPRGLHLGVYLGAYFLQRVLSSTLASPAAIFITTGLVSGAVQLSLWWLRGLLVRFSNLPPFRPLAITLSAALTGALALLVFAFAKRRLQTVDPGYGRRLG
jgi:hypothetical protein